MTEFNIIIDTEKYAGQFEREMVAYITSHIGECEVGKETAEMAKEELSKDEIAWFDMNLNHTSDDHGCSRPVSLAPTPGWGNNGYGVNSRKVEQPTVEEELATRYRAYLSVGMSVTSVPPENILKVIQERAKLFCKTPILQGYGGCVIPYTGIRVIKVQRVETLVRSLA